MLKGHVFKKQLFGNQIFALFIDTFLNKTCGIAGNYKEKMKVSYNGNQLTVASGAVCIKGRFLEEDTNTTLEADTDTAFCKLVIEIDLDKENTEETLAQASYKIIKSATAYPNLTQADIVANNSGIYQYELASFKTSAAGITNFQDKRTYLDFNSIYNKIEGEYRTILNELQKELEDVKDGSAYLLKSGGTVEGDLNVKGGFTGKYKKPKQINVTGDIVGNTTFDGEEDINIVSERRGCAAGQAGTATSKPWFKFASIIMDGANLQRGIVFKVNCRILNHNDISGILSVNARTNEVGEPLSEHIKLQWEYANTAVKPENFVIMYSKTKPVTIELWVKAEDSYLTYFFEALSEGDWKARNNLWTLYNNVSDGGQSEPTQGYTKKVSELARISNTSSNALKLQNARKIKIDGATKGEVDFDGSQDVTINTTQNNVFVLNGEMTLDASSGAQNTLKVTQKKISYPSGLNKDNCFPVALLGRQNANFGWGVYQDPYPDSLSMYNSTEGASLYLEDTGITIKKWNMSTEKRSFQYKIILMKI